MAPIVAAWLAVALALLLVASTVPVLGAGRPIAALVAGVRGNLVLIALSMIFELVLVYCLVVATW